MEIRNKKDAVFAAAILGIEIGIAVAIRSYMFYKDGRDSAFADTETSVNGNGEPSTRDSADLPADELVEDEVSSPSPDPAGDE